LFIGKFEKSKDYLKFIKVPTIDFVQSTVRRYYSPTYTSSITEILKPLSPHVSVESNAHTSKRDMVYVWIALHKRGT
jgi:hypothetical protein